MKSMINRKKWRRSHMGTSVCQKRTITSQRIWWLMFHLGTSAFFWPYRWVLHNLCQVEFCSGFRLISWNALALEIYLCKHSVINSIPLCPDDTKDDTDSAPKFLPLRSITWQRLVESSQSRCFSPRLFVCNMTAWSRADLSTPSSSSLACARCCRSPLVSGQDVGVN